jgi:hypothetical protein
MVGEDYMSTDQVSHPVEDHFIRFIQKRYSNESFKILKVFQRPYVGWEMDNECVVVKIGAKITLLGTNHGIVHEMNNDEAKQMISEMQAWLSDALHAITLLEQE